MSFILAAENDNGNVEYKRKLTGLTESRIEHLVTQMKWRLAEGSNNATYYVGIDDDGSLYQMTDTEMAESIETFKKVCSKAECDIVSLDKISTKEGGIYLKFDLEKRYDVPTEKRVALVGESGSGKSTLMSVLLYDELDDGKGYSRKLVNKHAHELESGRTSSIVYDYVGVSSKGDFLNYKNTSKKEEVIKKSIKLVTLIDFPGKKKYLKTTLFGILAFKPHNILYVIDGTNPSFQYIDLLNQTGIPWIMVINKSPITKPVPLKLMEYNLKNPFDKKIDHYTYINTCCVTGKGIDLLKNYIISSFDPILDKKVKVNSEAEKIEFMINEVSDMKDFGIVVGGILLSGSIKKGTKLYLNRDKIPVVVKSIHKKQFPQGMLFCDESASLMISIESKYIHLLDKHSRLSSDPDYKSYSSSFTIKMNNNMPKQKIGNLIFVNNTVQAFTWKAGFGKNCIEINLGAECYARLRERELCIIRAPEGEYITGTVLSLKSTSEKIEI